MMRGEQCSFGVVAIPACGAGNMTSFVDMVMFMFILSHVVCEGIFVHSK